MMKFKESRLEVFSSYSCKLGEGIYYCKYRNALFWLDIIQKKVFEKRLSSQSSEYDSVWNMDCMPSAILESQSKESLLIITEKGIGYLCLKSGKTNYIVIFDLPSSLRSNDAAIDSKGQFWVGFMEKKPTGVNGFVNVYSIDGKIKTSLSEIGIPNTFVETDDGHMLISDSYLQKVFRYSVQDNDLTIDRELYVDFSNSTGTPDGGIMSKLGNLHVALWGGSEVVVVDPSGDIIHHYSVPVLQVSNCCFGGDYNDQYLFVTSASEGLTKEQLERYPLSGCVFKIKIEKNQL